MHVAVLGKHVGVVSHKLCLLPCPIQCVACVFIGGEGIFLHGEHLVLGRGTPDAECSVGSGEVGPLVHVTDDVIGHILTQQTVYLQTAVIAFLELGLQVGQAVDAGLGKGGVGHVEEGVEMLGGHHDTFYRGGVDDDGELLVPSRFLDGAHHDGRPSVFHHAVEHGLHERRHRLREHVYLTVIGADAHLYHLSLAVEGGLSGVHGVNLHTEHIAGEVGHARLGDEFLGGDGVREGVVEHEGAHIAGGQLLELPHTAAAVKLLHGIVGGCKSSEAHPRGRLVQRVVGV